MNQFRHQTGAGKISAIVEVRTPEAGEEVTEFTVKTGDGPTLKIGGLNEAKQLIQALTSVVEKHGLYLETVIGGRRREERRFP